jgi:hypothetical protein
MASYSTTDRLRGFASRIDRTFDRKLRGNGASLEDLADNLTGLLGRAGRTEDALVRLAREQ